MPSLIEALNLLEEVEKIVREYNPSKDDKELIGKLLSKNMRIEAELYAKYIKI